MFTAQHQMRSQKGLRSQARVMASVTLVVAVLVAGSCSSDDDSTSSTTTGAEDASSTTAAPGTTNPAADDVASEPIVFEGGYFVHTDPTETPDGTTLAIWIGC